MSQRWLQSGVDSFTASAIASFRLMLKSVLRQVARQRGVRQQDHAMYGQSVFESSCASRLSIPHDANSVDHVRLPQCVCRVNVCRPSQADAIVSAAAPWLSVLAVIALSCCYSWLLSLPQQGPHVTFVDANCVYRDAAASRTRTAVAAAASASCQRVAAVIASCRRVPRCCTAANATCG